MPLSSSRMFGAAARSRLVGHRADPLDQTGLEQAAQAHQQDGLVQLPPIQFLPPAASALRIVVVDRVQHDDGVILHAQRGGGVDPVAPASRQRRLGEDFLGVVAALAGDDDVAQASAAMSLASCSWVCALAWAGPCRQRWRSRRRSARCARSRLQPPCGPSGPNPPCRASPRGRPDCPLCSSQTLSKFKRWGLRPRLVLPSSSGREGARRTGAGSALMVMILVQLRAQSRPPQRQLLCSERRTGGKHGETLWRNAIRQRKGSPCGLTSSMREGRGGSGQCLDDRVAHLGGADL